MTSPITTLLIDLDDTVYPPDTGVWPHLMERMYDFMHLRAGIPEEQVYAVRKRLFDQYGTTIRGLQAEFGADMQEYLAYVHDMDLSPYIKPDPALRESLLALPHTKWIFTNASLAHAENVLAVMGLRDLFTGIIDVVAVDPYCKPQLEAFEIALRLAGSPSPTEVLFIDDRAPNLNTARDMGLHTLLIGSAPEDGHSAIARLADLPGILV